MMDSDYGLWTSQSVTNVHDDDDDDDDDDNKDSGDGHGSGLQTKNRATDSTMVEDCVTADTTKDELYADINSKISLFSLNVGGIRSQLANGVF